MTDPTSLAHHAARDVWPLVLAERAALARDLEGLTDEQWVTTGRIAGLRLVATDSPFSTGTGDLVTGPTLALIMAMTGRREFCDDLTGDGAATLHERRGPSTA